MKILHINATDEGGTFNLMLDIHKALIKKNCNKNLPSPEKNISLKKKIFRIFIFQIIYYLIYIFT